MRTTGQSQVLAILHTYPATLKQYIFNLLKILLFIISLLSLNISDTRLILVIVGIQGQLMLVVLMLLLLLLLLLLWSGSRKLRRGTH